MFKGKNVLVTGGAGLVGQSLTRKLLDQGAFVRATQFKTRKLKIDHKNLEVVNCDLTDFDDARAIFQDMDIAFLGAAKVGGAAENKRNPSELIVYNLMLSAGLISLASASKLDKCAFISSSFVYPDSDKPHVEEEGFVGEPANYGLGWIKRYMETLCKHFHMTSLTDYAIIRPAAYYGPHDNFNIDTCHVIPALIIKALNRMDPFEIWGDGTERRCFTYVDDLVDGLLLTLDKFAIAKPINICSERSYTIREVAEEILKLVNFRPKIVYRPDKPTSLKNVVCDPSLAKKLLGWKPKTSLKNGLSKTMRGALSLV